VESHGARRHSGAQQQVRNAIAHFLGGFVGERDSQDGFGWHSVGNQICHAKGDRARFAGASAGENQQPANRWFRRPAVVRVQFIEKRRASVRGGWRKFAHVMLADVGDGRKRMRFAFRFK